MRELPYSKHSKQQMVIGIITVLPLLPQQTILKFLLIYKTNIQKNKDLMLF